MVLENKWLFVQFSFLLELPFLCAQECQAFRMHPIREFTGRLVFLIPPKSQREELKNFLFLDQVCDREAFNKRFRNRFSSLVFVLGHGPPDKYYIVAHFLRKGIPLSSINVAHAGTKKLPSYTFRQSTVVALHLICVHIISSQ